MKQTVEQLKPYNNTVKHRDPILHWGVVILVFLWSLISPVTFPLQPQLSLCEDLQTILRLMALDLLFNRGVYHLGLSAYIDLFRGRYDVFRYHKVYYNMVGIQFNSQACDIRCNTNSIKWNMIIYF